VVVKIYHVFSLDTGMRWYDDENYTNLASSNIALTTNHHQYLQQKPFWVALTH